MKWNPRLKFFTITMALLSAWFLLPLPHHVRLPAITLAVNNQVIYSPKEGVITEIYVTRNDRIKNGQPLVLVESRALESQIALLKQEKTVLQKKLDIIQGNDQSLPLYLESQSRLTKVNAELEGLLEQGKQNVISATVSGRLYDWDEMLHPNLYIPKNKIFGQIASEDTLDVLCYVPEIFIRDLYLGQYVNFRSNSSFVQTRGKVVRIAPTRASTLSHPQLAAQHGGPLPTIEQHKQLYLVESYYPVLIRLEKPGELHIGELGEIRFRGPWYSLAGNLIRYLRSIILRESAL